jgi:serine/threonine kinase 32
VVKKQFELKLEDTPRGTSDQCVSFINALIMRKPMKRLGRMGITEIKNHPWLEGFDWEALNSKQMEAPFIPGGFHVDQDFTWKDKDVLAIEYCS